MNKNIKHSKIKNNRSSNLKYEIVLTSLFLFEEPDNKSVFSAINSSDFYKTQT